MDQSRKDAVPAGSDSVETRLKRAREATDRAQHAEEEARTRIADATAQMAQARRLADEAAEAAEAARTAAAEAQQRADALSAEAQRQAGASTNGVAEAEKVQQKVARTAAKTTNRLRTPQVSGDPKEMTKNELMDLTVSLGVDGRRSMNKKQLVTAVNRESRKRR